MDKKEFFRLHTHATRTLIKLIHHYEKTLILSEFQSFLKHVSGLIIHQQEILRSVGPGAARAQTLHSLFEAEINAANDIPVSCKKGCSACCYFEVEVTNDEAELLADLIQHGHDVDRDRLARQATRERQDSGWQSGGVLENRCIFLDAAESCSIYESRPAACRKLAVTSPKELCSDPKASPTLRDIPKLEILMTAVIGLGETKFASLGKMVSAELAKRRMKKQSEVEVKYESEVSSSHEISLIFENESSVGGEVPQLMTEPDLSLLESPSITK